MTRSRESNAVHSCHAECPCQTGGRPAHDFVDGRERCFGERQVNGAWVPCPSPVREGDTEPKTRMEGLAGRPLYCSDCLEDFD